MPIGGYDIHVLVYEDGPRDAETLLVDPVTGQVTIVTKTLPRTGIGRLPIDPENGFSGVYQAPNPLGAVNVLTKDLPSSKLGNGCAGNTALAWLEKYQGPTLTLTAFDPPASS